MKKLILFSFVFFFISKIFSHEIEEKVFLSKDKSVAWVVNEHFYFKDGEKFSFFDSAKKKVFIQEEARPFINEEIILKVINSKVAYLDTIELPRKVKLFKQDFLTSKLELVDTQIIYNIEYFSQKGENNFMFWVGLWVGVFYLCWYLFSKEKRKKIGQTLLLSIIVLVFFPSLFLYQRIMEVSFWDSFILISLIYGFVILANLITKIKRVIIKTKDKKIIEPLDLTL